VQLVPTPAATKSWHCIRCVKLQDAQTANEIPTTTTTTMRWLLSFLLLGLLSVVHAVSSSGNKLLVILEELADKGKYSKYLGDLESAYISLKLASSVLQFVLMISR
jgi:hypothetical protein